MVEILCCICTQHFLYTNSLMLTRRYAPACEKTGGWWRSALISLDRVASSWMVDVSASVNLPLHHKVHKFSSGTGSPGWSQKGP